MNGFHQKGSADALTRRRMGWSFKNESLVKIRVQSALIENSHPV
jgi:hypothetical protein